MALNAVPGPLLIISASVMASGGRLLHHLRQRLHDPRSTVLLVGYTVYALTTPTVGLLRAYGDPRPELALATRTLVFKAPLLGGLILPFGAAGIVVSTAVGHILGACWFRTPVLDDPFTLLRPGRP